MMCDCWRPASEERPTARQLQQRLLHLSDMLQRVPGDAAEAAAAVPLSPLSTPPHSTGAQVRASAFFSSRSCLALIVITPCADVSLLLQDRGGASQARPLPDGLSQDLFPGMFDTFPPVSPQPSLLSTTPSAAPAPSSLMSSTSTAARTAAAGSPAADLPAQLSPQVQSGRARQGRRAESQATATPSSSPQSPLHTDFAPDEDAGQFSVTVGLGAPSGSATATDAAAALAGRGRGSRGSQLQALPTITSVASYDEAGTMSAPGAGHSFSDVRRCLLAGHSNPYSGMARAQKDNCSMCRSL